MAYSQIILVGLSGTGKSTIGNELARILSWSCIDTDDEIEKVIGDNPSNIIDKQGEEAFRKIEEDLILSLAPVNNQVISIGGGAFQSEKSRIHLSNLGLVFFLDAPIEILVDRLSSKFNEQRRPLLGNDLSKWNDLLNKMDAIRRPNFIRSDFHISTFSLTPAEIAHTILQYLNHSSSIDLKNDKRLIRFISSDNKLLPSVRIGVDAKQFPIWVGSNFLNSIPNIMDQLSIVGKIFIITDTNLNTLYGKKIKDILTSKKYSVYIHAINPGESEKNLDSVNQLYSWLFENKIERQDTILCLGGGVICDLGGFVASTALRGVKLISLPTSLLAMTDAAIGGKTGVNLPIGKNLIGSFKQPDGIIIDTDFLITLPRRELIEGFAEVIKHAIIFDSNLFVLLKDNKIIAQTITKGDERLINIITRSVLLKSLVVSADPLEKDLRKLLNFGHTIGHALETASSYTKLYHGEAVSIGMIAAARISHNLGFLTSDALNEIEELLVTYGLPISTDKMDVDLVMQLMLFDKKIINNKINFILISAIGNAFIEQNVPAPQIQLAIEGVMRG
jgi:3-dehydroquinate synthase